MQTKQVDALRYETPDNKVVQDILVVEQPLQIRVNGHSYITTMRTPGHDHYLARGLLFTEGVVPNTNAQLNFQETTDHETSFAVCLDIEIPEEYLAADVEGRRTLIATSSCGFCGVREPADITIFDSPLKINPEEKLDISLLEGMMQEMRKQQTAFDASGGCHGAAAFDREGKLLVAFEDVGRHNAVDKVVGALIELRLLDKAQSLTISGRVSYEIVYKAHRAQIPFLIAVSAPSSLAVEMSERFGLTLIAFCREKRATIYANKTNVNIKNETTPER